jgi:hypothetical protein
MRQKRTRLAFIILCAGLFILASPTARAQSDQGSQAIKQSESPESTICPPAQLFSFGAGAQFFRFCVSPHGNVLSLLSPAASKQLNLAEGYVACGTGAANAFDAGAVESGWGAATATQPGGPKTLPLTIKRQSTDGKFELTQTFDWNPAQKEITITMLLKNISAGSLASVKLARYFDGDLSNDPNDDLYDEDADSSWGTDSGAGAGHYGVSLTTLNFAVAHSTVVESFADFGPANAGGAQTAKTCTPIAQSVPTAPGNFVGRATYTLGTLAAGASKTVKLLYRRF